MLNPASLAEFAAETAIKYDRLQKEITILRDENEKLQKELKMSDDIVKRLKNNKVCLGHGDYDVDPLSLEAANEIERLRGKSQNQNQKHKQQIIALNESVKMVDDCYRNEIKNLKQQREEMRNEIVKLKEALKPFAVFAESWDKNPLRGIDDTLYSIHGGESCGGAELKLSNLKNARDAYNNTK